MANLYEVLAEAQNGEAMSELGQQFGLSPQQTRAAVAALLPAISMGLKQTTATPEGLGNLLAVMGAQPNFYEMYDDPRIAFSREGRTAGNAALSRMFGSPEASRAIADQAQVSGRSSSDRDRFIQGVIRVWGPLAASETNSSREVRHGQTRRNSRRDDNSRC